MRTLVRAPGRHRPDLTLAIRFSGARRSSAAWRAAAPLPTERPGTDRPGSTGFRPDRLQVRAPKHPRWYSRHCDNNSSFAALAGIKDVTVPISETAQSARTEQYSGVARGEVASGNYFDMLRTHAAHGRVFTPDDDKTPNAHPVVVISDKLWRARFNADPQTLGRVIYLNRNPFTVIGILPASFTGTVFAKETDFWAPLMMQGQLGDDPNWFRPGLKAAAYPRRLQRERERLPRWSADGRPPYPWAAQG